jgi:homoaconitate hydratase
MSTRRSAGETLVEKLARLSMTRGPRRALRPGDVVSLRPRHVLTHDNTSAVMEKFASIGARSIKYPWQPVFVLDHDIQNRSESNLAKYTRIEAFARQQLVDFHPAGTGIGHQIMVSEGYVVPGSLCVASDSHSNMYGALGALGTPIVRTDAAAVWCTGEFWWQIPRSVQVVLEGELSPGVTGKDLILALCGLFDKGEVLNASVEFAGDGVRTLSMDARLAIANMTTEWGALTGMFAVDEVTVQYMRGVRDKLLARGKRRFIDAQLESWASAPVAADPDASYAGRIYFDLSELRPMVSGPDTVQVTQLLAEIAPQQVRVHKAYLLSCVNGRLEDLRAAAEVLRGKRVHGGVELYVAAASREVQEQAEAEGVWQTIVGAGAKVLSPGCGPCIGLGTGLLEPGEVAISATNRNFKGRMGSRDAQAYLASPAVVAASAVAGVIAAPDGIEVQGRTLQPEFDAVDELHAPATAEAVDILPGFPARVEGRLLFVPQNNLNTDGIYGKDYTYQELPPQRMAEVVMQNYDPGFAKMVRPGDVLVGSYNFGTGSSREQAATALAAAGIRMVIAGSFSQTYLRNAYNNGFICITCPPLVSHLRESMQVRVTQGELTLLAQGPIEVDFARSEIHFDGRAFVFPALGEVPQSLVVAGGTESMIRRVLRLDQGQS